MDLFSTHILIGYVCGVVRFKAERKKDYRFKAYMLVLAMVTWDLSDVYPLCLKH